jgi:P27 family predicted phage terminase small subunit
MAGNSNSGRKAKPTKLKLVEGKTYRMAERANEPVPAGDLCDPPNHLNEHQLEIWSHAIEHSPHGLLKELDQALLTTWCVAQSIHQEATKALNNGPTVIKTPNGMPIQSPWLGILNKQAIIMRSLISELGFSPASRTRIAIDHDDEEGDITAKYFS